jgi:hypothetical protein
MTLGNRFIFIYAFVENNSDIIPSIKVSNWLSNEFQICKIEVLLAPLIQKSNSISNSISISNSKIKFKIKNQKSNI